jgi:DNA-binding NarL/FixJ family response regulator
MSRIRVMLAEDHQTVREGLKLLVGAQGDMEVVGEAENGREAVRLAQQLRPDVLVMDVSMPELNGLKATQKIRESCPSVRVLTLTRHTDDGYLQELLRAGACGYVLKQSASTELLHAIRAVAAGGKYLDPAITDKVTSGYASRAARLRGEASKELSERESEVLRLIAWGHSNKEIAARLDLSVKTVEVHKANAMRKLGIASRIGIVRYAILQGWLQDN